MNGTWERNATVLEILRAGHATRPQIALHSGMSKPTVSSAIAELEADSLVRSNGHADGPTGRKPTVYELNNTARLVLGIDIGGVNVRVAIADLRGTILAEHSAATDHAHINDQVITMARTVRNRVLRRLGASTSIVTNAVVSTPGVMTDPSRILLAYNVDAAGALDFAPLQTKLKLPVRVENNVNLAALGELRRGAARGVRTFVYLSVGAGIGVGTVVDGELIRGVNGAAGEISYLPLGAHPLREKQSNTGNFEAETAAAGLLERALKEDWRGHPPTDVADLFARAADGSQLARRLVHDQGERIGLAVVAARTMIDPELVILGGGIGRNTQLVDPVKQVCDTLFPVPCDIVTTELADRGSLVGAVTLAADDAWTSITTPTTP